MKALRQAALAALILSSMAFLAAQGTDAALSVLYFDNTSRNAEYDWLSKGLSDMTATDLGSAPGVLIVEREQLEKILKEQELALSGILDPKGAPSLGKILNAQILVYGSFIVSGTALRLDAKAVRAQTGEVVASARASGEAKDALSVQAELSKRLAEGMGLKIRQPEPVKTEAARSYYRGIDLFDQGKYADALAFFNEAQSRDPGFAKPGKSIEEAYRYLRDFKNQRYRREMNSLKDDIDRMTLRLSGPAFYSYADVLADPRRFGFKDGEEASAAYEAHPLSWAGDTPVQAIWELQNLYSELGDLGVEYFEDETLQGYCFDMMLSWAAVAERRFPKDPFLPETIYQTLFPYREREEWQRVMEVCERLMGDYPDYRMMWAVEDFYETALEELSPR